MRRGGARDPLLDKWFLGFHWFFGFWAICGPFLWKKLGVISLRRIPYYRRLDCGRGRGKERKEDLAEAREEVEEEEEEKEEEERERGRDRRKRGGGSVGWVCWWHYLANFVEKLPPSFDLNRCFHRSHVRFREDLWERKIEGWEKYIYSIQTEKKILIVII